jgi:hypothetical protein
MEYPDDSDKRKAVAKHAFDSERMANLRAMIAIAKSLSPIAANAEDFDKDPRIYKDTYTDNKGQARKTKRWYIDFRDHLKRRHKLAGFSDKKATRDLAGQIESLISCRASGGSMTPELQKWLTKVPDSTKKKLVKWGLVDAQRVEGTKLLTVHLEDWRMSILNRGKDDEYAGVLHKRVKTIFSGFSFYSEIH